MNKNSENSAEIFNETITQKVIKSVMIVFFVIGLTKLGMNYYIDSEENISEVKNEKANEHSKEKNPRRIIGLKNVSENSVSQKRILKQQPSCPKAYSLVILEELCSDLKLKKQLCSPEDFYHNNKHKIIKLTKKKSLNNEPKVSTFMNYVIGSLLITSLGAALIELYKAKKQDPKRNEKCPLSRKSSLADLTVMKHQRKELVRRESIMEVPEESYHPKQLGCNLSPLQRRCSFPVGRNVSGFSVNGTMTNIQQVIPVVTQMSSVEDRRMSVVDNRRQSLLDRRTSANYRMMLVEGKRFSVDDSPERKRYRHLVHRH